MLEYSFVDAHHAKTCLQILGGTWLSAWSKRAAEELTRAAAFSAANFAFRESASCPACPDCPLCPECANTTELAESLHTECWALLLAGREADQQVLFWATCAIAHLRARAWSRPQHHLWPLHEHRTRKARDAAL